MPGIILPGSTRPSNLRVDPDLISAHIEGDLYRICDRIKAEFGNRLFVVMHKDHPKPYVIMERADDGIERFVLRTDVLDGRVVDRLQYLLKVPLDKRLAEFEKLEDKHEAEKKEEELEELYENLGRPMRRQFYKDGFIDSYPTSYPIVNPKRKSG